MKKMLEILQALWRDIQMSFSIGSHKIEYVEPKTKAEVRKMADEKKPNKLRLWWRGAMIWLGIIDLDEVDGQASDSTATRSQYIKAKKRERMLSWMVALIIVAAIAVGVGAAFLIPLGGNDQNGTTALANGAAQESASPSPSATAVEDFVIDMPRRDGHRLNADGVKVKGNAEAFRKQIAKQAKHDPLTLFLYYNYSPLGRKNPIQNEADLVKGGIIKNGNVYSEEGRRRYNEWLVLWSVADIKSVREITFQGANTGVSGNRTTQSNGVTGNNKAGFDIGYRDAMGNSTGDNHSALERCTQPTGGRPGIPKGPTDNPKPPTGKNWRNDPWPQGNAPTGGGPNDDKGPGDYVPPGDMDQPPDTPYTPPPTPTPDPTPTGDGATPDPEPTPPPEDDGGTNTGTV
jgi:flagellar basal body-associated protein FliL